MLETQQVIFSAQMQPITSQEQSQLGWFIACTLPSSMKKNSRGSCIPIIWWPKAGFILEMQNHQYMHVSSF